MSGAPAGIAPSELPSRYMSPSASRNRARAKARGSLASNWRASSMVMGPRFCGNEDESRLELGKGDALLPHIFAGAVGVAHFARLVPLQEQELARALVGVDLRGQRRRVGEFQRHMAFPAWLER